MSDLKNVLKAGLLVTASLFATGCGNNQDTAAAPVDPNPNPNPPSTAKSKVPTFVLDLEKADKAFRDAKLVSGHIPDRPAAGYGASYDVLSHLSVVPTTEPAAAAPTVNMTIVNDKLLLSWHNIDQGKDSSFKLDASDATKFKPDAIHVGAMLFSGRIDTARHTFNTTVKGNLRTNAFAVRNAVFDAFDTAAASLASVYTYISLDSSVGYPYARQGADGKEVVLSVDTHSEPATATAQLSVDSPAKSTTTTATASKATNTTKVTAPAASKASATTTVVAAPIKSTTKGVLTLKTMKPADAATKTMLDAAGLEVGSAQGTLDIGGRAAVVEANDVVITAINGVQPVLVLPSTIAASATTTVAKTTTAAKKLALSAGTATKTTSTATSVAAASAATVGKNATAQAVVKESGVTKFLFEVKAGDLYSEFGDLKVGANTTFRAIAHHSLFAHTLTLSQNLNVRVLAEAHTFDKLKDVADLSKFVSDAAAADKIARGQEMMAVLSTAGHSVQTSDVVEADKVSAYVHYDSFTSFPLWVAAANVTADKTLTLEGIDLDTGVTLDAGVYALPLVKDMSGKLPNSSGKIAIAIGDGSSEIKEWKIMSNGYFDMVLVARVAAKGANLSSGALNRALMSSKAQAGRSVVSATLDAVVSKLDPTNLVSTSFASLSSSRLNQASQFASLARGVSVANAEKLGAVEQYAVTFNHAGAQFGLTYNLDGGNAFSSSQGTTSFGANVASDVLGLKAIVSAEASVDAGKNAYAVSSLAFYNAGVTFAQAYSLGGLSVVPMGGFGVSSNALNSYSAVVPMAAGMLGLSMNDVSFTAATFHTGVNLALDDFVATATGTNASLTLGVAGYLASNANATLSTSEGKSSALQFGGDAVTPYAQFNLGFATGEKLNTMISSGIAAVNFGLDR
ncbi:hypothetical protein [Candidatus Bodocaedibacter vickermanii]|uniref:Autotransporter domain-containing protein n=1 Tax=Candidatus Bodocaedibacter vickermanii TaxID=2741701 RepID=A0A7L9RUE8_9PROT|nr:hypothetical protein CPBP_01026 [Candidatus Paracaedibacteraceae bacterium 'Lake Konstanz']